jgi:hypothetical protein
METNTKTDTKTFYSIKEAEELVILAEEISKNIISLNKKYNAEIGFSMLFFLIAITLLSYFFYFMFESINSQYLYFISFHLISGTLMSTYFSYLKYKYSINTKKSIYIERKMLEKIYNIIPSDMDIYSPMTKAILEMRLSRISFDV